MWIEEYKKERFVKQHNDMNRWRTRICRVSMSTKNTLKFLEKRNTKTLETMRMNDIRMIRDSTDKRLMLDAMQMEQARSWPDLLTLDTKINTDVILP